MQLKLFSIAFITLNCSGVLGQVKAEFSYLLSSPSQYPVPKFEVPVSISLVVKHESSFAFELSLRLYKRYVWVAEFGSCPKA